MMVSLHFATASLILQVANVKEPGPSRVRETAHELLFRAFELNPHDVSTLLALGNVKRESGYVLAATRIFRAALMVAPYAH